MKIRVLIAVYVFLLVACNKYPGMVKVPANAKLATPEFYIDAFEAKVTDKKKTNAKGVEEMVALAESLPDVDPASNIVYADAKTACEKADKRICKYKEWLAACRGPNNFTFGFQSTSKSPKDVSKVCDVGRPFDKESDDIPSKTNTHPDCKADGVLAYDLIGNVAEWVDKEGEEYAAGSVYSYPLNYSRCEVQENVGEDLATNQLGFRCCKDVIPE